MRLHCSVSPSAFVFFFYCYGPHRDLHSFPTRRSSDLGGRAVLSGLVRQDDSGSAAHGRRNACRDRKSTRLNSSHVEISYAVFCLKKKSSSDHLRLTPCI